MVETKIKGLTTELLCQVYLTSLGYNISIPIGEDCRYDMILDLNGKLLRIQVKTCQEEENRISFRTCSITTSGKENITHKYTKDQIDLIATYYNDQCYLIPIEECEGMKGRSLVFSPEKTNAIKPLYIKDYTAEIILNKILNNEQIKKEDDFIVYQYDLNNNLLNQFSSYAEAGTSINKPSSHISQCARGLRKTAYGFIWSLTLKD